MRELESEFAAEGVVVRFVVMGTPPEAARFCARFGDAARCVGDPQRRSYAAMGLEQFNLWHLFKDRDLRRRRAENRAAGFSQDWGATKLRNAAQLPGAAIVDAAGTLRWIYRGRHPGDLPAMTEMLAACRRELHGDAPRSGC